MVLKSISNLKTRGGSSRQAIKKFMLDNYSNNVNEETINIYLRNALKKGVESGALVQNKQSFKLGSEAKKLIQ
jgi:hypothetical protein